MLAPSCGTPYHKKNNLASVLNICRIRRRPNFSSSNPSNEVADILQQISQAATASGSSSSHAHSIIRNQLHPPAADKNKADRICRKSVTVYFPNFSMLSARLTCSRVQILQSCRFLFASCLASSRFISVFSASQDLPRYYIILQAKSRSTISL